MTLTLVTRNSVGKINENCPKVFPKYVGKCFSRRKLHYVKVGKLRMVEDVLRKKGP